MKHRPCLTSICLILAYTAPRSRCRAMNRRFPPAFWFYHQPAEDWRRQVRGPSGQNRRNRWFWQDPTTPLKATHAAWARTLKRRFLRRFYVLPETINMDGGGKWLKNAIVELGYNEEGKGIIFVGQWQEDGKTTPLFFSDRGMMVDDRLLAADLGADPARERQTPVAFAKFALRCRPTAAKPGTLWPLFRMANVSIRRLCKDKPSALARGGPHRILHDISMEIADGEFLVLVGPSGWARRRLRCIAGLKNRRVVSWRLATTL